MKIVIDTEGLMLAMAGEMKKVKKELRLTFAQVAPLSDDQSDRALELLATGAIRACFASADSLFLPVPADEVIASRLVSVPLPTIQLAWCGHQVSELVPDPEQPGMLKRKTYCDCGPAPY